MLTRKYADRKHILCQITEISDAEFFKTDQIAIMFVTWKDKGKKYENLTCRLLTDLSLGRQNKNKKSSFKPEEDP